MPSAKLLGVAVRRRPRWWRVAVGALVLATSCSAGGGQERTSPGPTTTSTTSTTTTTTAPTTTTTALPPSKAVDGDPMAGNLSDQNIDWLDVRLDESTIPHRVVATNRAAMPIEISLDWSSAVNISSEPAFPMTALVPPLGTIDVARIFPVRSSDAWSYRYDATWLLGDPAAVPADVAYVRPRLKSGGLARIAQAPGGTYSHTDVLNKYAYDFSMPIGTPVLAARAGTVATIEQGFTEAGETEEFSRKGNNIRVLHDDGTWAVYVHLDPRSARVRIGDKVEVGQVLALSGNTGRSKGPHLHLAVQANRDHAEESVPFEIAVR